MLSSKTRQIKQLHELQKQHLESSKDNYSVGIYNGLELALAICEKREPNLLYTVNDVKVFEQEEAEQKQTGKTKYSGVRRR